MQNINKLNTTKFSLELFHIQTNTSFDLPANVNIISIGKRNQQNSPDIDISNLPDAEVASRIHAEIQFKEGIYFLEDLGSSNGTFLNDIKLPVKTPYQLNLGDTINLGQGDKITFIFQHKQNHEVNILSQSNATTLQPQIPSRSTLNPIDKTSKFIGLVLISTGIVMLAANLQIGIFFRLPSVILCIAGVYILFQKRINQSIGWILIALGIAMIVFSSHVFASGNLLIIIVSFALFIAGCQLFTTGKILNHDLRSIWNLIKK